MKTEKRETERKCPIAAGECSLGPTCLLRSKTWEIIRREKWSKQATLLMEVVIEARSSVSVDANPSLCNSLIPWSSLTTARYLFVILLVSRIPGVWSVVVTCCFHGLFLASLFGTCRSVGFDSSRCYQDPTDMKPSSKHDKSNSIKWSVNQYSN